MSSASINHHSFSWATLENSLILLASSFFIQKALNKLFLAFCKMIYIKFPALTSCFAIDFLTFQITKEIMESANNLDPQYYRNAFL